ncbi:MAG: endolytic transglycosylase MltG, partial [Gammaproteobacteria bacterium]|nr:endolytic transglycosylase MltG [Gammaproteobacteria bacterium]
LSALQKEPKLRQDLAGFKNQQILDELKLEQSHPEGWFYPDTYNYQKGASDLQILQNSHQLMNEKLQKYWNERDLELPYETAYDVLIMASLIEKETGLAGERDRIAGVFVRRLNMNIRLQTDPTVIYGMGNSFDGNLRRKDLLKDTPYNTYRRKGLPPTPIAMPSEASLSAAVHPAGGTELYFVARGDGSHQFSTTLEEHNRAVRRFQLKGQ